MRDDGFIPEKSAEKLIINPLRETHISAALSFTANGSWKETLAWALAWMLLPVAAPFAIIKSKMTGKTVMIFPVTVRNRE